MRKMIPSKLLLGDTICIIAPSKSLSTVTKEQIHVAENKLTEIGLNVVYGKHVEEIDEFNSSSVESRVFDLHQAFEDKKIDGILAAIGGFNSNHFSSILIGKSSKIIQRCFVDIQILRHY